MNSVHILIIEDDEGLRRGISYSITKAGYTTYDAENIEQGRKQLEANDIQVIVLDVNLPDGSGFDFCKEVRRTCDIPILMLTARDSEWDEIEGLDSGADDYITKPFSIALLLSRLQALLRRTVMEEKTNTTAISQGIRLDHSSLQIIRGEKIISLSATEYKLLKYMLDHKNQVLLKEQIIGKLWDSDGNFIDENTLPVNIRRLRQKIEDDPSKPELIKTVHGMGYIFV